MMKYTFLLITILIVGCSNNHRELVDSRLLKGRISDIEKNVNYKHLTSRYVYTVYVQTPRETIEILLFENVPNHLKVNDSIMVVIQNYIIKENE